MSPCALFLALSLAAAWISMALQAPSAARPPECTEPMPVSMGEYGVLDVIERVPLRPDVDDDGLRIFRRGVLVTFDGRIVVPSGNGRAHVFEQSGERVLVCRPMEHLRRPSAPAVAVDRRGRILVQRLPSSATFVPYSRDGSQGEALKLVHRDPLPFFQSSFAMLSSAEGLWVLRDSGALERIDELEVVCTLATRPDGSSWEGARFGVGADDRLVVLDHPLGTDPQACMASPASERGRVRAARAIDRRSHMIVYDRAGRPLCWIVLPPWLCGRPFEVGQGWVAFAPIDRKGDELDLLDLATLRVHRCRLAEPVSGAADWGFPVRVAPNELWCVDTDQRCLVRFALPLFAR